MWVLSWSTQELIWTWVLLLWALLVHPKFQVVLRIDGRWPFSKDRSAVLEDFFNVRLPPFIFSWSCVLTSRGHLTVHSCTYPAFGCWFLPSGVEELKSFSASILHSPFVIGLWGQAFSGFLSMAAKLWLVICGRYCKRETFMPLSQCRIYLSNDTGIGSWAWIYFLLPTQG